MNLLADIAPPSDAGDTCASGAVAFLVIAGLLVLTFVRFWRHKESA